MNKYHNKPVEIDGIKFDSMAEGTRYRELDLLQRHGQISNLRVHPKYILQEAFKYHGIPERAITYEGDFEYISDGIQICEDVKGVRTEVFKIKRKLFINKYPDICFVVIKA